MKRIPRVDARRVPKLCHLETIAPGVEFVEEIRQKDKESSKYTEYTQPKPLFGSKSKRKIISFLEIATDYNVKMISSRQMVALSFDLYTAGYIDKEQHLLLSFQAELQPNFDDTIGALINQNSAPDKQRDFIELWLERCVFEQNYPGPDHKRTYRLKIILNMLTALDKMAQTAQKWQKTKVDDDQTSIPNFPSLSLKRTEY